MIATLAALPIALLASGLPVFLVFLVAVAATLAFVLPMPPLLLQQVVFGGLDNYALLAVPFFVFAGDLMGRSGIADRLIKWVLALTGRIPGSLGVGTIGASSMMGAISGSSAAAVAALGKTLYPQLVDAGYGRERSAGLLAASGAIDIVIPPSIAMILYGLAAEQSIPHLFLAGIIPGLVIAAIMSAYVVMVAIRAKVPRAGRFDLGLVLSTSKSAVWGILMPVVVLGGIYGGFFSPTEAGGVAAFYAMLVARYVYRSMSWGDIVRAAADSAVLSAKILIIVATAGAITWLLTTQGVPQAITSWLQAMDMSAVEYLLCVNVFLLITGCVLDPTSAILVLAPLLVPVAAALGVDPIHFGVIMTVNLAIGMFTPPFGLNLFVAQSVTGVPAHAIYRGVWPFVLVQIAALLLVTYVPALSLALVR
ncbi:TRAP transporter large permease [Amorphus orientalis]|uniref:TRAP transporter large permease protein n=1 Tax=Amorphus orientalis TaxID=649198 RepID=A0AAE3VT88_9HYPH|nr:TRAP transporter large permease [Amorphus orientalis]MDQ0317410.1 C4-dicarboxylate transporter DctM subunit [Amorphus orientalis]